LWYSGCSPRDAAAATGLSPCLVRFPTRFVAALPRCWEAYNPSRLPGWFGLLRVRSPLLAECSLFLRVLRCFSSPGSPLVMRCCPRGQRVSPFGNRRLVTPAHG